MINKYKKELITFINAVTVIVSFMENYLIGIVMELGIMG
jgi:hypothetical protein